MQKRRHIKKKKKKKDFFCSQINFSRFAQIVELPGKLNKQKTQYKDHHLW